MIAALIEYYKTLWHFTVANKPYSSYFNYSSLGAKVYVYSLSLMFRMWNLPHYRNKDFQTDLLKNLRNVAIPGTGIPLSWFCIHKSLVVVFLWVIYPLLSFLSALLHAYPFKAISLSHAFSTQLLCPEDWFSLWQLNCRIASFHALLTHSSSYQIENKWEFLQQGAAL